LIQAKPAARQSDGTTAAIFRVAMSEPAPRNPAFETLRAWYFVLVWGSGYLASKVGLRYAPPFTFLALRFAFGLVGPRPGRRGAAAGVSARAPRTRPPRRGRPMIPVLSRFRGSAV